MNAFFPYSERIVVFTFSHSSGVFGYIGLRLENAFEARFHSINPILDGDVLPARRLRVLAIRRRKSEDSARRVRFLSWREGSEPIGGGGYPARLTILGSRRLGGLLGAGIDSPSFSIKKSLPSSFSILGTSGAFWTLDPHLSPS